MKKDKEETMKENKEEKGRGDEKIKEGRQKRKLTEEKEKEKMKETKKAFSFGAAALVCIILIFGLTFLSAGDDVWSENLARPDRSTEAGENKESSIFLSAIVK